MGTAQPSLPLANSSRTVETWFKTTNTAAEQGILSYGTAGNDGALALFASPQTFIVDTFSDAHTFPAPRPLNDGRWHLVTVTYDATKLSVYLDGQAIGSSILSAPLNTLPGPLTIGDSSIGNYGPLEGEMQELAVFPSALTATQVAAQFKASGYSRPTAPSVVHAINAGSRTAQVSWGYSSASNAPVLGYLLSVAAGPNKGEAVAVGNVTAARTSGLAASSDQFTVRGFDSFGFGPAATSNTLTVPGAASTYVSTVLGDRPSVYYRLGDATTAVMADSSGHQANGVYNPSNVTLGVAGAIPGDADTAIGDQGHCCGYATAWAALPSSNAARSAEVWLQSSTASPCCKPWGLMSWGQPGTDQAFSVIEANPSMLEVSAFEDDHYFLLPYPIDDRSWHLVAVTYDGSTIQVYLDGLLIGSGTFNGPLDTLPGPLQVGTDVSGNSALIDANLDELAVFPTALSAAQVAAQFNASGYNRPTAPTNATAVAGTNQATVTWSPASAANAPLRGYLVTALRGATRVNSVAVAATATSTVVSGLAGGTTYSFEIQAVNAYGLGPPATTATATPAGASSTYASTVLGDSPSLYYRLGDSTTALMADSGGHQANGTYNATNANLGVAGAIPADPDTAVAGSGNDLGTATAQALPVSNQPRSVEAWFKTTTGSPQYVAAWGTEQTREAFSVAIDANHVYVEGSSDDLTFTTTGTLDDGNWHYLAVTSTGSAATVYIDGVEIGTQTFPVPLDTISTSSVTVGGNLDGFVGINGTLDEVAIYPTALTATQVQNHYSKG
jgi:hypothetical protein